MNLFAKRLAVLLILAVLTTPAWSQSRSRTFRATPTNRESTRRDTPETPEAPILSPAQLKEMKAETLPGTVDRVFKSCISVLHEQGWRFSIIQKDVGLIQASSPSRQDIIGPEDDYRTNEPEIEETRLEYEDFKGGDDASIPYWKRWEEISILIDSSRMGEVRVQISLVKFGTLPAGIYFYPDPKVFNVGAKRIMQSQKEQSISVDDPKDYQVLFAEIRSNLAEQN